jgi:nucleotidyltransferase substrate binding protein (TIGR01987 family)
MVEEPARWRYRLDHYAKASERLREAVVTAQTRELSLLEKEGMIQRFEYSWELAWKMLKDYLESQGIVLEAITPAAVIKKAYAAKIIDQGEVWMQALDARNKMSHSYDAEAFEVIVKAICRDFTPLFVKLLHDMQSR